MSLNKYTLDRYEGDYAIFLKHPEETEQLLIHQSEIDVGLEEGDIVQIKEDGEKYTFEALEAETKERKETIKNVLADLKNKKR